MERRLTLEQWALGKLPPAAVAELEQRCADDPDFAEWAARVRSEVTAAAVDLPMLRLPAEVDEPAAASWFDRFSPLALAGAAGLAVIAFTILLPSAPPVQQTPTWRGSLDVQVHLIHAGEPSEQGAIVTARPGDRLQFRVAAPAAGTVQVYDVQADRTVQQWLAPRPVAAQGAANGAVLLDDYAGGERVYFVWHPRPLGTAVIADAVERAYDTPIADLDTLPGLPKGAVQRSILLLRTTE